MMENLSEIIVMVGSAVTGIVVPLIGVLMYRDYKKRTEAAKAKQAEASAKAAEIDNINSYAQEWKTLYEKHDAELDEMKRQATDDRKRIRELTEENMRLSLELQKAQFLKCEVKGCEKRQPPTGY